MLYEVNDVQLTATESRGTIATGGAWFGDSYSGNSESVSRAIAEWRKIDEGSIYLTNQRFVFLGQIQVRELPIDSIFKTEIAAAGLRVYASGNSSVIFFELGMPEVWHMSHYILAHEEDPFALKETYQLPGMNP